MTLTLIDQARTDDGEVYSWGISECWEVGRKTIDLKAGRGMEKKQFLQQVLDQHLTPGHMYLTAAGAGSEPTIVRQVKSVGCGAYHSLVVLVGGSLLTCGLNNYAQLGLGDNRDYQFVHVVTSLAEQSLILARGGMHHSCALTSTGKVFAWGRSDYCQLGSSDRSVGTTPGSFSTNPVEAVFAAGVSIKQLACGGNHNLALSSGEVPQVFTWGYGDMSALGHGRDQDEPTPKKLDFTKAKVGNIIVTQVSGGGQHSAIIGRVLN